MLTEPEGLVGFFLQFVIVSLCSPVLLMRVAWDRERVLKRGNGSAQEGERLFQNDTVTEDETVQRLYRDNSDDARVW